MKFGLMTQIQMPRPWTETTEREGFWHAIDQVVAAEAAGFDYFWITEQHFFIEIGHCSSPEMVLAAHQPAHEDDPPRLRRRPDAAAQSLLRRRARRHARRAEQRARRVRRRPRHLALHGRGARLRSRGRAATSGARRWRPCIRCSSTSSFPGYKGKHFDLPARHVVPRPIQRPHPPLWVAASNLETYEHAGKQGFGFIGVTRNTPAETKPVRSTPTASAIRAPTPRRLAGARRQRPERRLRHRLLRRGRRTGREIACAAARWYYRRQRRRDEPGALQHGGRA